MRSTQNSRQTEPLSTTVEQLVRDGRLGVKSGHGFYDDNDQRVAELTLQLYQVARQLDSGSPRSRNW
jgi:3-hydroxyacyl-CoA dehydrogenase